jgi:5,10-methylenetetrahydromethanopterin reductase
MELWSLGRTPPATIATQAAEAERDGWHGLLVPDTQCAIGDTFVALAVAATATVTLQLGTGVTNPYTRHPAVTAAAIAGIDAMSGGRAVLGVGRGDSSLAHVGLAPAPPATLERFLARVQGYLRGEAVPFDDDERVGKRRIEDLGLAGEPAESRLLWLDPATTRKVPVDVAATGPKVISLAARIAERLTFAVGADVRRLTWAMTTARQAREDAGLDPADLSFGAYVNLVAHPDARVARDLASVGVSTFSRFSVMHGKLNGPVSEASAEVLEHLAASYDMNEHGASAAKHSSVLTAEHIDSFGIVGSPGHCVERLKELESIGIDRVAILAALADESDELRASRQHLVEEVLPSFARV